ncbi:MAG: hypothetical protein ABI158_06185 [Edaphobacter sp.]
MTLIPPPPAPSGITRPTAPPVFLPRAAAVTPPPVYRPASPQGALSARIQAKANWAPRYAPMGAPPVYRPAAPAPIQPRMAPATRPVPVTTTTPLKSMVVQRTVDTAPIDRKAVGTFLKGHLEQRVKDLAALSKWNINAEGRNQGLVHLLDYAYARPSSLSVTPEATVKSQTKLNDSQYRMLSGLNDPTKAGISHEILTTEKREYKFTEQQLVLLVSKGYLEVIETPAMRAAKNEVAKLDSELKQLATAKQGQLVSSGVTGKAIGVQLAAYKSTDAIYRLKVGQLTAAESKANALTTYMTKSDMSKRGRLGLIATAGGLGSIERGKEIEKGTEIITRLMTGSAPTQTSITYPTRNMILWQPTGGLSKNPYPNAKAGPGTKAWHEVDTPPSGLKSTASGEFKGSGLTVKVWGVLDDPSVNLATHAKNLGISTVMGGS